MLTVYEYVFGSLWLVVSCLGIAYAYIFEVLRGIFYACFMC